jgi:putative sugar O-methyltransferase
MEIVMVMKSHAEYIFDLPLKGIAKLLRYFNRKSHFTQSSIQSDSETTRYSKIVWKFINSEKSFKRFRRQYDYRIILEHVDFKLGKRYIDKITEISPSFFVNNFHLIKNDLVGSPRVYRYRGIGTISPTTLRYVSVMLEIKKIFNANRPIKIAEIGIGYGGQFVILDEFMEVESYSGFDLPQVLKLSDKFISSVSNNHKFIAKDIYNIKKEDFDLVISNYAFSELPIQIQREYLEKVIFHSKMGYMIMNSGNLDITGRSKGKIGLDELNQSINGLEVLKESPLTGPDNYLLVWGRN